MKPFTYDLILEIIHAFYDKAKTDILIGYHFRHIENFETHIPRIADFWQLQLTGTIDNPQSLPFNIIDTHKHLMVKTGEVDRWVMLFTNTLDEFIQKQKLSSEQKEFWLKKIKPFRDRIYKFAT